MRDGADGKTLKNSGPSDNMAGILASVVDTK